MSITVSAVKARQNLGELLNIVSIKHEDVIIERAGKKIVRLTSVDPESGAINEPIAAAACSEKVPLISRDKHFLNIPGLQLIVPE